MKARIGKYYRSKFNHYVAKVIDVNMRTITMETINANVIETIARENFDENWIPCTTIYDFRNTIRECFAREDDYETTITLMGDTIRVDIDDEIITFSIDHNDMLKVYCTDEVRDALSLEYNITRFLLEDTFDVINVIASLFKD